MIIFENFEQVIPTLFAGFNFTGGDMITGFSILATSPSTVLYLCSLKL
jgi:hypothetical protein